MAIAAIGEGFVADQPAVLLGCDFDGTQVFTYEKAPGGIDVDKGYEIGIREHIGDQAAERYIADGGHRSRSPVEIVSAIHDKADPNIRKSLAAKIVATKLSVLEDCVGKPLEDGTPWPRASEGFVELWHDIDQARAQGRRIGTAVISNGHTSFEQKVFDMLGITQPDIYITDDVLQAIAHQIPHAEQVKPAPYPLRLAQTLYRLQLESANQIRPGESIETVIIGDADKDEQLAANSGVDFVYLRPDTSKEAWQQIRARLHIGHTALHNVKLGHA